MRDLRHCGTVWMLLMVVGLCVHATISPAGQTSRYIFLFDQSQLIQTGGIAGVHWTYRIEGQFLLTIDPNAGTASFAQVDAYATDDSEYRRTLDPNEVFNMTLLTSTILDANTISFTGKAPDGSDVDITVTLQDGSARLTGQTTPPPNTADFFVFALNATAQRKYAGGTGTAEDPYQIATAADLITLGETPADYDKYFLLTADIDLDPNLPGRKVFDRAVIASDTTGTSDFDGTAFRGVFDGYGHTVSHITIIGDGYLGLFGRLGLGAEVLNVCVADVNVTGFGSYIGGLAGYNDQGSIVATYAIGTVSGKDYVGGLVGFNGCSIIMSRSTSTVNSTANHVGGLVGYNSGSIAMCSSTGTVSGVLYVGGLAGYNDYSIAISYSTSSVSGSGYVGGLVGNNSDSITASYSTGTVSGDEYVGGLVGRNRTPRDKVTSITASFWDIGASGETRSDGGTGLSTAEMRDINTYLNAGWDFIDEARNGTCDYWQISPGDCPRLRCHVSDRPVMPEGSGTALEPYLIRNARDLGTVWLKPMAHYRLESPVNLSEIAWSVAVVPWFGGTFDGNDHVISNLYIHGSVFLGLFGQLCSEAKIANLGLEAADVNATENYVGSLVAVNHGSIAASYSTGLVSGSGFVGGLVGINYGDIAESCNEGTVSGVYYVGGLVACNFGSINTSHSVGTVVGTNYVGGLVGTCYGIAVGDCDAKVTGSYSTATVTGSGSVGGLVGDSYGTITESYSNNSVAGSHGVGGLIGCNYGNVVASCSTAAVAGIRDVGGLVGYNGNTVAASYSTGAVSGTDKVGGFVGWNRGSIMRSYSTGPVSGAGDIGGFVGYSRYRVVNYITVGSFWDTQTSGQATSAGGTGKTTVEMQMESTFADAGWDFVGETANGTEDIWWIDEGRDYPRLWWELIPDEPLQNVLQ